MPKITQVHQIDISPEKFLQNCSRQELIELELLLSSNHYQHQMHGEPTDEVSIVKLNTLKAVSHE